MKYWGYRVESQSVTLWHVWPHTARKSMSRVPRLQLWVSTYITDPWIPCLSSSTAASQSAFSKASALTEVLKNYLLFFFVLALSKTNDGTPPILVFVRTVSIIINHWLIFRKMTILPHRSPLKNDENNFTGPAWFMDTTISHTAFVCEDPSPPLLVIDLITHTYQSHCEASFPWF